MAKNTDNTPPPLDYAPPTSKTLSPWWRWSVRMAFLSFLFNATVMVVEITQYGFVSDTPRVHAIAIAAIIADFLAGAFAYVHLSRAISQYFHASAPLSFIDLLPILLFVLGFMFVILVPTFQKA